MNNGSFARLFWLRDNEGSLLYLSVTFVHGICPIEVRRPIIIDSFVGTYSAIVLVRGALGKVTGKGVVGKDGGSLLRPGETLSAHLRVLISVLNSATRALTC